VDISGLVLNRWFPHVLNSNLKIRYIPSYYCVVSRNDFSNCDETVFLGTNEQCTGYQARRETRLGYKDTEITKHNICFRRWSIMSSSLFSNN